MIPTFEVIFMAKNATRDLTVGSPMKLILSFMLPLLFGLLFQQFYSMVDTVVVGKFLGVDALAGVGSTGSINFLVLGLCNGVCAGFAIPVAQKFGQKDFEGLRRFVGNMIWLGTVIALIVTLATTTLCASILRWMDTPEPQVVPAQVQQREVPDDENQTQQSGNQLAQQSGPARPGNAHTKTHNKQHIQRHIQKTGQDQKHQRGFGIP